MKAYVATTGAVFLLVTIAHVFRATQERNLVRDPWFLIITAITLGLGVWAVRVYQRTGRTTP